MRKSVRNFCNYSIFKIYSGKGWGGADPLRGKMLFRKFKAFKSYEKATLVFENYIDSSRTVFTGGEGELKAAFNVGYV